MSLCIIVATGRADVRQQRLDRFRAESIKMAENSGFEELRPALVKQREGCRIGIEDQIIA